jgi:hypothetical protein
MNSPRVVESVNPNGILSSLRIVLISLLRLYRLALSPLKSALFGVHATCRFTPTCSCYAIEAIQNHGAIRGSFLTLRRLLRCHPCGGAGYDPVPLNPRTSKSPCRGDFQRNRVGFPRLRTILCRRDETIVARRFNAGTGSPEGFSAERMAAFSKSGVKTPGYFQKSLRDEAPGNSTSR